MMKFKSFLSEAPIDSWNISWKDNFINHILYDEQFFYISPHIIKNILGHIEIESFHGTTIEGLKKLKSIQYTRKTVSSFTKLSNPSVIIAGKFSGDYKESVMYYQVLCKLHGTLIFGYNDDIWSKPDEKGIRGIGLEIKDFFKIKRDFLNNEIRETWIPILKSLPTYNTDFYFKDIVNDCSNFRKNVNYFLNELFSTKFSLTENKKIQYLKNDIQAKFYQLCKQFIKDNKEYILTEYLHKINSGEEMWNEILISNFYIKEFIIIDPYKDNKNIIENKLKQLNLINKCSNYSSWIIYINSSDIYKIKNDINDEVTNFINHGTYYEIQ